MRSPRHVLTALALVATGTVATVAVQQSVSATVSSGERPVLIQITPCRITDTRPSEPVGPRIGKLGPDSEFTINTAGTGTPCAGQIPADATGVSTNITVLEATDNSFLTVWPGGTRPFASSLNPSPGEPPTPNGVAVGLSGRSFKVYNNRGATHVIVDINGYYVDHDHDDRYSAGGDTVSVGAAAFDAWESEFQWEKSLGNGTANGGAWITAAPHVGGGGVPGLAAPVQLPDGATITSATAYFEDSTPTASLAIQLRCEELDGGVKVVANGGSTSSPASGETNLAITTSNAVVDNSECSYFVIAESGSWASAGDDLKIRGISITTS